MSPYCDYGAHYCRLKPCHRVVQHTKQAAASRIPYNVHLSSVYHLFDLMSRRKLAEPICDTNGVIRIEPPISTDPLGNRHNYC
jgi:hypothetical protein